MHNENVAYYPFTYIYYPQKDTKRISLNLSKQDIEEIAQMEIAEMKERSRLRMEAVSPEIVPPSSPELMPSASPEIMPSASPEIMPPTSPEIMPQHVCESKSLLNSIELPVFGPLPEGVSITINGINDPVEKYVNELTVKDYVSKLIEDRDMAITTAQSYREKVEALNIENQKLNCEMHDRVQRIRTFWRNKIVEGGTRAGKFVKKALNMHK